MQHLLKARIMGITICTKKMINPKLYAFAFKYEQPLGFFFNVFFFFFFNFK
jgi:hypothetical protein